MTMNPVATDPTYYCGTVSRILPKSGFGFAECAEVKEKYGDDTYLHSSQLEGLQEGMTVSFRVSLNAKGRPQAVDLIIGEVVESADQGVIEQSWMEALEQGAAKAVPQILESICEMTGDRASVLAGVEEWSRQNARTKVIPPRISTGGSAPAYASVFNSKGKGAGRSNPYSANGGNPGGWNSAKTSQEELYIGTVSAIVPPKNGKPPMGFVKCDATYKLYHDDVFLHSTQAEQLQVGQSIRFKVQVNARGKPQATDVELLDSVGGENSGGWNIGGMADGGLYTGTVSAIVPPRNGKPGMGFVKCDETYQVYHDDVFLHSSQAEQLQVGQSIQFKVQVNARGKPQATDVELLDVA